MGRYALTRVLGIGLLVIALFLQSRSTGENDRGSVENSTAVSDIGAADRPRAGSSATPPATSESVTDGLAGVTSPERASGSVFSEAVALSGWPSYFVAADRFAVEGDDPEWSSVTESRLLGTIAEIDDLSLFAVDAECRLSMCLLSLVFPDDAHYVYVLRKLYIRLDELGLGPASASVASPSGDPRRLSLYLRRVADDSN